MGNIPFSAHAHTLKKYLLSVQMRPQYTLWPSVFIIMLCNDKQKKFFLEEKSVEREKNILIEQTLPEKRLFILFVQLYCV